MSLKKNRIIKVRNENCQIIGFVGGHLLVWPSSKTHQVKWNAWNDNNYDNIGGRTSSNTLGELLVVNEMLNRRWGQERQLVSGGKQIHQSFDIENNWQEICLLEISKCHLNTVTRTVRYIQQSIKLGNKYSIIKKIKTQVDIEKYIRSVNWVWAVCSQRFEVLMFTIYSIIVQFKEVKILAN